MTYHLCLYYGTIVVYYFLSKMWYLGTYFRHLSFCYVLGGEFCKFNIFFVDVFLNHAMLYYLQFMIQKLYKQILIQSQFDIYVYINDRVKILEVEGRGGIILNFCETMNFMVEEHVEEEWQAMC